MSDPYNGALLDERDSAAQALDFHEEEVPLAAGTSQYEKVTRAAELPFYEIRDQAQSTTCMNQAAAKIRGITLNKQTGRYIPLSGGFAYRRKRSAGGGMALWDIMDLVKNGGLPLELIDPSQNMSESQILNAKELSYADEMAKLFASKEEKYIYLPHNFDAIVNVIEQGYPVLLMLYANRDEYEITPRIIDQSLTPQEATIRHGIAAHKVFSLEGEDFILMDESWGIPNSKAMSAFDKDLKGRGQRKLTREWVNKRVYGAAYSRELRFDFDGATPIIVPPDLARPRYRFTKTLRFIPIEQRASAEDAAQKADVIALQNILKYEGIFDASVVSSGYYGAITARAVEAYQRKHSVASPGEIDQITGPNSSVGPKTIAHLNSVYAP